MGHLGLFLKAKLKTMALTWAIVLFKSFLNPQKHKTIALACEMGYSHLSLFLTFKKKLK
jgi:hypothetical protein